MRLPRLRRRAAAAPAAAVGGPPPVRTSPVGTRAGLVIGVTPTGELSALEPVDGVVLFLTSTCLACRDVWSALADGLPATPRVAAVVTPDATLEDRRAVAALAGPGVPVVMSSAAWQTYAAGPSPWAAVVMGGLVVAEGGVEGWAGVEALARGR